MNSVWEGVNKVSSGEVSAAWFLLSVLHTCRHFGAALIRRTSRRRQGTFRWNKALSKNGITGKKISPIFIFLILEEDVRTLPENFQFRIFCSTNPPAHNKFSLTLHLFLFLLLSGDLVCCTITQNFVQHTRSPLSLNNGYIQSIHRITTNYELHDNTINNHNGKPMKNNTPVWFDLHE